jgi:hypothetical protein
MIIRKDQLEGKFLYSAALSLVRSFTETLVNDEPIIDGGKKDDAQPGNNAPNAEKGGNPQTIPEVEEEKEV